MSSETAAATVFVVDDDPAARESIRALALSAGYNAVAFRSGEEFLAAYDPSVPGCLVTDLRLLGMSGIEIHETLLRRGIKLPVIVVSGYADVPTAVRVMRKGAVTLFPKPFNPEELIAAVRQAISLDRKRRAYEDRVQNIRSKLQRLTEGAQRVLKLLVEGKSNKQIALELDLGLRTVERRRQQILQKLEVSSVVELVRLLFVTRLDPVSEPQAADVFGNSSEP
ncbi:MAG: response regulator transcription factor [Planctomycetes bacterium]|nr:response regulator transcription factor [Planctomycetota bacterium]